jgi:hypothetical protein
LITPESCHSAAGDRACAANYNRMRWGELSKAVRLRAGLFVLSAGAVAALAVAGHAVEAGPSTASLTAVADLVTLPPLPGTSSSPSPSPSPSSSPTANPLGGTDVCGDLPTFTTTRWTATGSPYRLCPGGVRVPPDAALVLDGSAGPIQIVAMGSGGLTSIAATISTESTSEVDNVVMDSTAAVPGAWAGVTLGARDERWADLLEYVQVRHAVTGIHGSGYSVLRHVDVTDTSADGFELTDGATTIEDSSVSRAGRDGISADHTRVQLRRNHVSRAARCGIRAFYALDAVVTDNVVVDSGSQVRPEPAILVAAGEFSLGGDNGVDRNLGAGNALNAIALRGVTRSGFTWITPHDVAPSSSPEPLGMLNLGLASGYDVTVVVPPGSVVKSGSAGSYVGSLLPYGNPIGQFSGGTVVVGEGSTFTSLADDSVGMPTCTSALSDTCTPQPGDWVGISSDTSMTIHGATVRYARSGVYAGSETNGSNEITDVLVEHSGGGLWVRSGLLRRITVRDGHPVQVDQYGGQFFGFGVRFDSSARRAGEGAIDAEEIDVADVTGAGIDSEVPSWAGEEPFRLVGVRVARAGEGVRLQGLVDPIVQDVDVVDVAAGKYVVSPAVSIDARRMTIGPGRHIDRITGARTELDAISLTGSVVGGLTWVSPAPHGLQTSGPLGYVSLYGSLTLLGGTLDMPPGSVAKTGGFRLEGATLDTTSGAVQIVGPGNTDVLPKTCHEQERYCGETPSDDYYGGPATVLVGHPDASGSPSHITLVGADVRDLYRLEATGGSTLTVRASSIGGQQPPMRFPATQYPSAVWLENATASITDTAMTGLRIWSAVSSVDVLRSSMSHAPAAFDLYDTDFSARESSFDDMTSVGAYGGMFFNHSRVTLDRVRITGGTESDSFGALLLTNGSTVTAQCTAARNSRRTLTIGDADSHADIVDSDLYDGQTEPEFQLQGPATTSRVWFGQAGGPRDDQVDNRDRLTVTSPASSLAPQAAISVDGTPDGSGGYANGTLTIRLDLSRTMNTDVQPTVTITGPDGQAHTVPGAWSSRTVWVGSYTISSATSRGRNRIEARDARGCVFDPATNTMSAASRDIDVSGGTASAGGASGGGSSTTGGSAPGG